MNTYLRREKQRGATERMLEEAARVLVSEQKVGIVLMHPDHIAIAKLRLAKLLIPHVATFDIPYCMDRVVWINAREASKCVDFRTFTLMEDRTMSVLCDHAVLENRYGAILNHWLRFAKEE